MRICLFTSTFLPKIGGTEIVTDALARQFTAMGHHAMVLAMGRAHVDTPYPVVRYGKSRLWRYWPELTARPLARLHQRERFDIVCANYGNPTGYGAVKLGERVGVPVVVVSHGSDIHRGSNDRRRPRIWWRVQYAYRNASAVVAISPHTEQMIREISPDRAMIETIPNGVNLQEMREPSRRPADFVSGRPYCLCLGNLRPIKGFDTAVSALSEAGDRLGQLDLVIVGGGPQEESLRYQAQKLNLANRVIFVGPRSGEDKRWFIQNCRFGIMPSREEGHPIVALEFLACGKPLVCSDIAAFDGMYDEGVNAYRVAVGDAAAFSKAMVRMNESALAPMANECRRRSEQYDWPKIAGRYVDLFERVLNQASRATAT